MKVKKLNILFGAFLFVLVISCSGAPGSVSVLSGDFETPELKLLSCESSDEISLIFSKPVTGTFIEVGQASNLQIESALYCALDKKIEAEYIQKNSSVLEIKFREPTKVGESYIVRGTVIDENKNTLTFASVFSGYNDRVPELVLSEVQTKYSNPKAEFVEIYAKTQGNLSGVCIYSAYDGAKKRYEFPPVDVKAGEYIVVHYRNIEADTVNETGEDLKISKGTFSSNSRDLWLDNTSARLGDKTDVILLEKSADGTVLDAVAYADSSLEDWPKEIYKEALHRAAKDGVWQDESIKNAVNGDRISVTRTLSRQGSLDKADVYNKSAWLVTATNTASPGGPNSSRE